MKTKIVCMSPMVHTKVKCLINSRVDAMMARIEEILGQEETDNLMAEKTFSKTIYNAAMAGMKMTIRSKGDYFEFDFQ